MSSPVNAAPTAPAKFVVKPQTAGHQRPVQKLLNLAFGPGRLAKSSYRFREGVKPINALSFVAEYLDNTHETLAGSIRYWPILIGPNAEEKMTDALLLGPLAVAPDMQGKGAGMALMQVSLEKAKELGHKIVVLVGDEPYYARIGFSKVPAGLVQMPQPYDPDRLLWLELVPGAFESVRGVMTKAPA